MESSTLPELDRLTPNFRQVTAAEFKGKGGVTLWKKQGPNFSVVVYQLHDEPYSSWKLDQKAYDMIELRVISARVPLKDFWKPTTKRLTHWKKSWILACTDAKKPEAEFKKDVSGIRANFLSYAMYETEVDKALENGEKTFETLAKTVAKKPSGSEKPWAVALRNDTGDPESDRYWVVAVYPDGDYWNVKIHRGQLKSFGFTYPASWENGYVFESFKKADDFAQQKVKAQSGEGYATLTDPQTLRVLKWSLQHVEGA